MTQAQVAARLAQLCKGAFQTKELIMQLYGLSSTSFDYLIPYITAWAIRRKQEFLSGSRYNRFVLEQFYVQNSLIPPLQAACRLATDTDSLARVAKFAKENAGVPETSIGKEDMGYREDFVQHIIKLFPTIEHTIFSDHNNYCRAIHSALKQDKVEINMLIDPTSKLLKDADPDVAHYVDILNDDPIGLRYNVWLNFNKPFSLEPDKVSAITFVKYRSSLNLDSYVPDYFEIDESMLTRVHEKVK